jgi:negative regulator of flagellin synthesis FlgM
VVIVNLLNATSATEASGQTSRISSESGTAQASQAASSHSYTEDTTSLTSASDSVQGLSATALAGDPARAARVQSLKQAVSQGQYSIDPEQIASALSSAEI